MLFENILWPGVLAPGLFAAVALAGVRLCDRRGRESTAGGGSLAIGAGFVAASAVMTGWPRWPPGDSTQRLFYVTAAAALVGLAWGWFKGRGTPWLVRGVVLGSLLVLMLKTPLEHKWSPGEAAARLAALMVVGLAVGWALEASLANAERRGRLVRAAVRLTLLTGMAVSLSFSGSARLGQLMGAVACAVFVVEVGGRLLGRRVWLPGDAMVLSTVACGLLLGGFFYATLDAWNACLLALSLLLLGLGVRGGWAQWLPLLPCAIAVTRVALAFVNAPDPYDY